MHDAALAALRRRVHDDAALQARLFALTDTAAFVAAVRELARASGVTPDDEEIRQAMAAGRRAWIQRKRP